MRKLAAVGAGGLCVVLGAAVWAGAKPKKAEEAPKVAQLAFMTGSWERQQGTTKMEEHWTTPVAGCMMGMFRQVAGDKTAVREFEVIEETPNGVIMTIKHFTPEMAEIPGRVLVRKLIQVKDDEATFESTGEEPKQKLIYTKTKDGGLGAKIELLRNGKVVTLEIPMKRMGK